MMKCSSSRLAGRDARRGGVLVLALMAVMSVTVLAAGFLQLSSAVTRRQVASLDGKRAFYLAEAGLSESYAALSAGLTGNVGSPALPARLGDGVFWVEATPNPIDDTLRLESTALVGSGRASLAVVVEPREVTIGALGVFSVGQLDLGEETLVDGWNSMKGPYAGQVEPETVAILGGPTIPAHSARGAVIGSNADITITGGSEGSFLFGRALHGVTAGYSDDGNVVVTGSVKPSDQSVSLPAVQVPAMTLLAPLTVDSPTPVVFNGVDKGYQSILIEEDSELIVRGPANLVVDDLTIVEDGVLTLDSHNGPIQLYVKQQLQIEARGVVATPSGDPRGVTIQAASSTGTNVLLNGTSQFHGTIYSPSTGVIVSKNFEVYGAIVASSLDFADKSRLHVDKALGKSMGLSGLPSCLSWRIVENPVEVATNRGSIQEVLGVDVTVCPDPKDAHADVWLELDYNDAGGTVKTYTGWDSGFNWNDVSLVNDIKSFTDDPGIVGEPVF